MTTILWKVHFSLDNYCYFNLFVCACMLCMVDDLLLGPRRSYDSDDDYEVSDAESPTNSNDYRDYDDSDDDDFDDDDPSWKPSWVNVNF